MRNIFPRLEAAPWNMNDLAPLSKRIYLTQSAVRGLIIAAEANLKSTLSSKISILSTSATVYSDHPP